MFLSKISSFALGCFVQQVLFRQLLSGNLLWTGGEDSSHSFSGEKLDSQSCGNKFFFCNFSLVICCGLGEKTFLTLSQVKSLIAKVVVISSSATSPWWSVVDWGRRLFLPFLRWESLIVKVVVTICFSETSPWWSGADWGRRLFSPFLRWESLIVKVVVTVCFSETSPWWSVVDWGRRLFSPFLRWESLIVKVVVINSFSATSP